MACLTPWWLYLTKKIQKLVIKLNFECDTKTMTFQNTKLKPNFILVCKQNTQSHDVANKTNFNILIIQPCTSATLRFLMAAVVAHAASWSARLSVTLLKPVTNLRSVQFTDSCRIHINKSAIVIWCQSLKTNKQQLEYPFPIISKKVNHHKVDSLWTSIKQKKNNRDFKILLIILFTVPHGVAWASVFSVTGCRTDIIKCIVPYNSSSLRPLQEYKYVPAAEDSRCAMSHPSGSNHYFLSA